MQSLIFLCVSLAAVTASVIPSYGNGYGSTGWADYGTSKWGGGGYGGYHHAPVATSYASVWKVDHPSVPVVYKPVVSPVVYKPVLKTYPSYGYAAWDTAPSYGLDHSSYGTSSYGHY